MGHEGEDDFATVAKLVLLVVFILIVTCILFAACVFAGLIYCGALEWKWNGGLRAATPPPLGQRKRRAAMTTSDFDTGGASAGRIGRRAALNSRRFTSRFTAQTFTQTAEPDCNSEDGV